MNIKDTIKQIHARVHAEAYAENPADPFVVQMKQTWEDRVTLLTYIQALEFEIKKLRQRETLDGMREEIARNFAERKMKPKRAGDMPV